MSDYVAQLVNGGLPATWSAELQWLAARFLAATGTDDEQWRDFIAFVTMVRKEDAEAYGVVIAGCRRDFERAVKVNAAMKLVGEVTA